jgi:hypothetical protein
MQLADRRLACAPYMEQHMADTVPAELNISNYLDLRPLKPQEAPALAPLLQVH